MTSTLLQTLQVAYDSTFKTNKQTNTQTNKQTNTQTNKQTNKTTTPNAVYRENARNDQDVMGKKKPKFTQNVRG